MCAVVSATEDLLLFILAEKGQRGLWVFLLHDIIRAADIFVQDEVCGCIINEKIDAKATSESKEHATLTRVAKGFPYLNQAVKLAPEIWTAILIPKALKPEVHRYSLDIISALPS